MRQVRSEAIATERLLLRPCRHEDEPDVVALVTDADVMRFVGDGVMTEERGRQVFNKVFELYDTGAWGIWTIEERETGGFLGTAEIKPRKTGDWEIVYVFRKEAWGRGYATEVGRALVAFGFENLGLARVAATVDYENAISIRVLEKLGMRQVDEESDEIGPYAVYAVDRPIT